MVLPGQPEGADRPLSSVVSTVQRLRVSQAGGKPRHTVPPPVGT
jgi:hypothetical protein